VKIVRFCQKCGDYEGREIPINSAQLYDWMSGTPLEIAAKNLTDDELNWLLIDEEPAWHQGCEDRGFGFEVEAEDGPELDQDPTIH